MKKVQLSLQLDPDILNFWALKDLPNGFCVGSEELQPFFLEHSELEDYLIEIKRIFEGEYSNFLEGDKWEVDHHLSEYLTLKLNGQKALFPSVGVLLGGSAPIPSGDIYEGVQRPNVVSWEEISNQTK